MVPLGRELVCSHCCQYKPPLHPVSFDCNLRYKFLTGGLNPSLGEAVVGGPEMDPLSSSGTTTYRLSIVTIGLYLTVFAVLWMFQTDRRKEWF